jgi:hypothetical protein
MRRSDDLMQVDVEILPKPQAHQLASFLDAKIFILNHDAPCKRNIQACAPLAMIFVLMQVQEA